DQHEFGVYKQVFLIVATSMSVLPLGVSMSAFYFLPRDGVDKGNIVLNVVLFHIVVGGAVLALLVLDPGILQTIFNSSEVVQYGPLIGLAIFVWTISSFLEVAVVANQETRLATIFIVGGQFTKTLLLVAAALSFGTVRSLAWAAVIQGTLQTVALIAYLKLRFWHNGIRFSRKVLKTQLSYAIPFGAAGLILRVYSDLHNYFVSYRFGAALYATYAVGCFNLPLTDILSDSIGSVTLPRVSYLQHAGRTREIIELMARAVRKMTAACLPLYVFLLVTAKPLIGFLFTDRYLSSWPIFAVNLTMIPLAIVSTGYDPVIRAYMEHRYFLVKLRGSLAVLLIALLWAGTTYLGLMGAILAVVGVSAIERVAVSAKVAHILGVGRKDVSLLRDVAKLAGAASIAGVITLGAEITLGGMGRFYLLAVAGTVYATTYISAVFALGVPSEGEKRAARQWIGLWLRALNSKRQPALSEE
ncbi:MAG: oligosaccharide flippase family protein, partial [Blastocatellia bacterium]